MCSASLSFSHSLFFSLFGPAKENTHPLLVPSQYIFTVEMLLQNWQDIVSTAGMSSHDKNSMLAVLSENLGAEDLEP